MTPSSKTLRSLGKPTLLLTLAAAGPALGTVLAVGVALPWADELRAGGATVWLLLVVAGFLGCGLWVLPTHVLSLLCGWSLGGWAGAAVALATASSAAPLGYVVARRFIGDDVLAFVERYPRGAAVCAAVTRASPGRAALLLGLLRLSPVVPYGATNVLAAAFAVPWPAFVVGTVVGLAPRVVAVALLGAGLQQLDFTRPGGAGWLVVGLGATVAALGFLGWVTQRVLRRAVPVAQA
ncbi:MAG: VTT domain-containing protein [Planctomycetota bacterium]